MSKVKGAGDSGGGSNPRVQSKYDRSKGKGITPPHLTHPGETAPLSGTRKGGYNEGGHMDPRDVSPAMGAHKVHVHSPQTLGEGVKTSDGMNSGMTDSIRSEK